MKKDYESFLYGIATLATILIIVAFIGFPVKKAFGNDQTPGATSTTTTTSIKIEVQDIASSTISASNGEPSASIKPRLPQTADAIVYFIHLCTWEEGDPPSTTPRSTSSTASSSSASVNINWEETPSGYSSSASTAYSFTWSGSTPSSSIRVDEQDVSFDGKDDFTATVSVAAPEPETVTSITGYDQTKTYDNGTASSQVLNLPTEVTVTTNKRSNLRQSVSWNHTPEYNQSSKELQTITARGTVALPAGVSGNNTIETVITVKAYSVLPSNYTKLEKGDYDEDDDHKSLGITTSSLSEKRVGTILDYVYAHNSSLKAVIDDIISKGESLSIAVAITKLSSSDVDDDVKDAMKKRARDYDGADDAKLANYFDISLYITGNDRYREAWKITDPGKKLTFSYAIPSSIKSSSSSAKQTRYYNVVRYHDGKGHSVGLDYTTNTTLEFDVSEFSPFATAYYDKSSSSSSSSSSSARAASSSIRTPGTGASANTAGGGGGSAGGGKAPKTGDDFNAKKWVFFLVIGVVVALCSFILYQDTKEWRDENK